jgi:molecular chaperone DnaK
LSFGIDFGTSNSVLAHYADGHSATVPLDSATIPAEWHSPAFEELMPSIIGLIAGRERPCFGWEAKIRGYDPVEAVKRLLLGRDRRERIGDQDFNPTVIAAALFAHMRQSAERNLLAVDRAVITVPANATGAARFRTRAAARLAGIEVAALINEPTAAVLAYAHDLAVHGIEAPHRILVFDWGGGTIDVTIVDYENGLFEERSSHGIQQLGGLEFDGEVLELALRKLGLAWRNVKPGARKRLCLDAELAKITLSSAEKATISAPDGSRQITVTRDEFEEAALPLVHYAVDPIADALRDLDITIREVDTVLLVGGTTRIPLVRRVLAEKLGPDELIAVPETVFNPMTAVARGAAIYAARLDGAKTDLELAVTTHYDLAVRGKEGRDRKLRAVIGTNRVLPAEGSRRLYAEHKSSGAHVRIYEGDARLEPENENNILLTELFLAWPANLLLRQRQIDLTYRYDVSGILRVRATVVSTGQVLLDKEIDHFGEDGTPLGHGLDAELERLLTRGGGRAAGVDRRDPLVKQPQRDHDNATPDVTAALSDRVPLMRTPGAPWRRLPETYDHWRE